MNKQEFTALAIDHLISKGKSIKFFNRDYVQIDGVKTGGYYDGDMIAVSTKNEHWFETFIHEYCHFLQELDKDYILDSEDEWESYDKWLIRKAEVPQNKINQLTEDIRNNEIDCEKRVVRLIEKYGLPIDKERYIQESNVYALFYTLATKYRMWYKGTSPCSIEELMDMMPKTFRETWDDVPEEFEKIVKEQCFKISTENS